MSDRSTLDPETVAAIDWRNITGHQPSPLADVPLSDWPLMTSPIYNTIALPRRKRGTARDRAYRTTAKARANTRNT